MSRDRSARRVARATVSRTQRGHHRRHSAVHQPNSPSPIPVATCFLVEARELAVHLEVVLADVAAGEHVRLEVGVAPQRRGSGRRAAHRRRSWSRGARRTRARRAADPPSGRHRPAPCPRAHRCPAALRPPRPQCAVAHQAGEPLVDLVARGRSGPPPSASHVSPARSAMSQLTVSHSRSHSSSVRQVTATSCWSPQRYTSFGHHWPNGSALPIGCASRPLAK